jgi:hypothetical protein
MVVIDMKPCDVHNNHSHYINNSIFLHTLATCITSTTSLRYLHRQTSQLHEHGDWHGAIDDLVAASEQASNAELFGQGYGPRKLLHR